MYIGTLVNICEKSAVMGAQLSLRPGVPSGNH